MSDKFAFSLQELIHALMDSRGIDADPISSGILHQSDIDGQDVFVLEVIYKDDPETI